MRAILLVALALTFGCAGHVAFGVGCDADTYVGSERPAWVQADVGLCAETE